MHASKTILSLGFLAALTGCGGAQTSATLATPTPAPAPEAQTVAQPTPQPAQHAEAHLDHGHITLEHQIQFDLNSDHIREEASQSVLNDLVALLRENPQIRRVRVEGHTDLQGNEASNRDLSQRRAQAVAAYLRGHGFENIEFEAVGYGMTQPLCREDTEACHERNRRVEFTITDPAQP